MTDSAAIKESGISPVHSAAAGGHPQCLEFLLKSGFDANFMLHQRIRKGYDDERRSALYFAVSNGDIDSVQLLLDAGALPNQDPVNCLQLALRMGNYELIGILLRHGANVNYFCRVNTTHFPSALQYTLKDEVMLRMLLNYGYNVHRCFDCPHGASVHSQYIFEGWTSTVIKDTMVSASDGREDCLHLHHLLICPYNTHQAISPQLGSRTVSLHMSGKFFKKTTGYCHSGRNKHPVY